jgi:hypothetical protein
MVCGAVRHPPGTVHCPTRVWQWAGLETGRLKERATELRLPIEKYEFH